MPFPKSLVKSERNWVIGVRTRLFWSNSPISITQLGLLYFIYIFIYFIAFSIILFYLSTHLDKLLDTLDFRKFSFHALIEI